MTAAIAERRNTITIPWLMNLLTEVITRAPEWVVRRTAPKARDRSTL
jgi:hypothetical protein